MASVRSKSGIMIPFAFKWNGDEVRRASLMGGSTNKDGSTALMEAVEGWFRDEAHQIRSWLLARKGRG